MVVRVQSTSSYSFLEISVQGSGHRLLCTLEMENQIENHMENGNHNTQGFYTADYGIEAEMPRSTTKWGRTSELGCSERKPRSCYSLPSFPYPIFQGFEVQGLRV